MSVPTDNLYTYKEKSKTMNETLGQIIDKIFKAVSDYHSASMGDDSKEIASTEAMYNEMIRAYGATTVALAVDFYNKEVIRKA